MLENENLSIVQRLVGALAFGALSWSLPDHARADVLAACNGCNASAYKAKAIAAANGTSQIVHVIDNSQQIVKKYSVVIENEPGVYVAMAREQPADVALKEHAEVIWRDVALMKGIGRDFTSIGSVTDYLRNYQQREGLHGNLRDSYFTFSRSLTFNLNNGFLAAFNLSQPIQMTLRFADGSEIIVDIKFALDVENDGAFEVRLNEIKPVQGTARIKDSSGRWVYIPMRASDFNGFYYQSPDQTVRASLESMATHFGARIDVIGSSGGFAMSCAYDDGKLTCIIRRYY